MSAEYKGSLIQVKTFACSVGVCRSRSETVFSRNKLSYISLGSLHFLGNHIAKIDYVDAFLVCWHELKLQV